MTKVFSYTQPINNDIVDAFCVLQKGFTDQFVYYNKQQKARFMGLGRCVAFRTLPEMDYVVQGPAAEAPIMFSFNRFDGANPSPTDSLFAAFPELNLLLPEIVLIENERGRFLQLNSLGPVYEGRVTRFVRQGEAATARTSVAIPYNLEEDSRDTWQDKVKAGLAAIGEGNIEKVVLSRRRKLTASHPFSSKDLLVNLIDGPARGSVLLYRYGDVFFCGCSPELLIQKRGQRVESMCLAGTTGVGSTDKDRERLAHDLLNDDKNLREHGYVVDFIREVFRRNCHDVRIGKFPQIMSLEHVQHLYTPISAQVREGVSLVALMEQIHPTPALSGAPVGEAMRLIRQIESYNRGFFGGAIGYVDGNGDGAFSVGLRTGVFDGEIGWVYAGCGIVDGSDADEEYDEVNLKFKTILDAFCGVSYGA